MNAEIENCLARILSPDGRQIAGAGILFGGSHVITCAHVVNQALHRPMGSVAQPDEKLNLDFPFFQSAGPKAARVVKWCPIQEDGSGDIAVLLLEGEPLQRPGPVLIADAEPDDLRHHEFETYGFPSGQDIGVEAHGKLLGRRPDGSIQIESGFLTGYRVQSGFSGAPVLDKKLNTLVGMVVMAERQPDVRAAFMIPAKVLAGVWPELALWMTPPYPGAIRDYMNKIPKLYHEVEKDTGNYVRLSAVLDNSQVVLDVVRYLKEMLCDRPNAFIMILGDYGSGKTKLAYRLAYELANQACLQGMRSIIPFYLHLSYSKNSPITTAIPEFLRRYSIDLHEADFIYIINQYPNLVLILDGFDEMVNRTNWDKVPEMIELLKPLREFPGVRVVITSRTSFFRDQLEEHVMEADETVYVSKLGDDNITEYLEANDVSTSAVNHLFKRYPEIKELCRLPIHIFLLSRHLSTIGDVVKQDFLPIDLYKSFVERVLVLNTTPEWPPGERREFLQKLAYRWFHDELFEIRPAQMRELIGSELPDVTAKRLQELTMHFLSSSLFCRIENNYRFIHYSFVEFFVAEILVDDLYSARFERLAARTLYAEIFDFMSQFIQRRGTAQIPFEKIVASQDENVLSNFLATMTRNLPTNDSIKPYFERLLIDANHDLVRCLACQGLGLCTTVDTALIQKSFSQEQNSIIKSVLRRTAEHLAENATSEAARQSYLEACSGVFELRTEDAERILKTTETSHSLNGYRRALRVGDRRWTTTVAAMYLLAGVRDEASYADIKSIASETEVPAIRKAFSEIESWLK